jgi:NADPH-dependent ferric siderophore reductase
MTQPLLNVPPAGPGRRRPPPIRAAVVRRVSLSPHVVRITVGGEAMSRFTYPGPAAHFKLILPSERTGEIALPAPGEDGLVTYDRSFATQMRTYTARRFDSASGELDIDIVLHGEGPAARWAADVASGGQVALTAARTSGFALASAAEELVLAVDAAGLPAAATILETRPALPTTVLLELEDPEDAVALPPDDVNRRILVLGNGETPGRPLIDAISRLQVDPRTQVWVAAEARAIRAIRTDLVSRGVVGDLLTTRGYWQAGESNHPDHDYGEGQVA